MNIVSLFSGCGGLDLGFQGGFHVFGKDYPSNDFNIIWANDIYPQACETYRKNIGDHILNEDIESLLDKSPESLPNPEDTDIVIGGFPCQDFSVAGKRQGITVQRGKLYLQMKKTIERLAPKVFVAENVEGLVNMNEGIVLNTIKQDLSSIDHESETINYRVSHHLLHAADYGVPQIRKRVFIVGIREDIMGEYNPPSPTHVEEWMTAIEAIDDIWQREDDETIFNHNQLSRAKFYPGRRLQGNMQISAYAPSVTIRAEHHGNIEAHYRTYTPETPEDMSGWRRLTVRECARLQSFPDNFEFMGSATHTYKQVGNAVPPVLAWHVASSIRELLDNHERHQATDRDVLTL
ncbi:DNA (cytosine-5)-methyltransferase 1 [Salsuginibacillus halophilus]|uniref:Cytosine-specific methyltransferase n=1 Tax=Salsuginibacillus halophilus TaxID=517424 RepID=A0A2P8H4Z8_9BACI|nr:DNA cytosine methyltransferase [Salsuginibacillus halophilus]PSL41270.1 DNA (cytosine-5)-methyltransferase 1 [Salsuginibacillus halophilus]